MAMVSVVTAAASLGGSEAQADWLGPQVGGRPALVLHSLNEPGELSQWQCHDDSTVNIVVAITIIITVDAQTFQTLQAPQSSVTSHKFGTNSCPTLRTHA